VTAYAAQSFVSGDSAVTWGVTFTGYHDSVLGYSESWIFGGPGWANQLAGMNIPAAP
jgi:hypothetical protein